MNPNVNDFNNTNTQPILNHQFIDINAHQNVNHANPFAKANTVQQNLNFSADTNYAPPASDMNQNYQPQQQGFAPQQTQYEVNQGFQTGFPNATVQMNTGPQVTYTTQPTIQVVQPTMRVVQQPSIQVVTQPSYTVTTQPNIFVAPKYNNVVVTSNGITTTTSSYGGTTYNTTVTGGQQAARVIFLFVFIFIFFFIFLINMITSFATRRY